MPDAIDGVSEVLFGLIMVLAFEGSLRIAAAGRLEVRTMLVGAFGCSLAWGIIDGISYLMGCLAETSRGLITKRRPWAMGISMVVLGAVHVGIALATGEYDSCASSESLRSR